MRIQWAEWRGPIYGRRENGFIHPAIGMVLHIMGSSVQSADNWFKSPKSGDPNSGAGATFGVCNGQSKNINSNWTEGHLIQWADTDDRCWAQGQGNSYYHSIETEGASGPLTPKMIETIARLYKELHDVEGFPFALAEKPGDHGFGWHGMGGAAWGGHDYCPGPERRAQRGQILQLAQGGSIPSPISTAKDDDDMYEREIPGDSQKHIMGLPNPGNSAYIAETFVSFASDFDGSKIRYAVYNDDSKSWRLIDTIDVKASESANQHTFKCIKGDSKLSIVNSGPNPLSVLVQSGRK